MWKVLLADDEEIIVQGIKKLVDWQRYGMEVVGEALDGEKALELIKEKKPDLVITDIKMPKLSGLDVLHKTEGLPGIMPKFIFISAFQEFEYVREALAGGAVDYLLKPVRKTELEHVIEKTMGKLQEQSTIRLFKGNENENTIQQIFRNINDGYEYAEEDLYKEFSSMDIDFSDKFSVGLCFGILPRNFEEKDGDYEKNKLVKFVIYDKIRAYFKAENHGFVVRKDDTCCNLIGLFDRDEENTFIEKYIVPIKEDLESEYGVHLCVGIGERINDISNIKTAYQKARLAYDLYYFEEKDIIDINTIKNERFEAFDGVDDFNKLSGKVFSNIASKSENTMDSIREVLELIRKMHYGNANAAVNQCLVFFSKLLEQLHSYDMIRGSFSEAQEEILEKMQEQRTFRELTEFLLKHFEGMLENVYRTVRKKDVAVIVQVKEYLHENYMKEISLKDLADMVCVSPSYFSTFFKNTTGENYKSYLIKIRMSEALKLVMNTDLKTYEIAERVGYNNVRRFVDAFKNHYEMSPMDYRKLYKKNQ